MADLPRGRVPRARARAYRCYDEGERFVRHGADVDDVRLALESEELCELPEVRALACVADEQRRLRLGRVGRQVVDQPRLLLFLRGVRHCSPARLLGAFASVRRPPARRSF